jgi:replication factor C subunit 1
MWSTDAMDKLVTKPDSPTSEKKKVVKGGGSASASAAASGSAESGAKKRSSFQAFKNREGPRGIGTKTLPVGKPNCLAGLKFVVTGVLESIEREAAEELILK